MSYHYHSSGRAVPLDAEDISYAVIRLGYGSEYLHPHTGLGSGDVADDIQTLDAAIRQAMRMGAGSRVYALYIVSEPHRYQARYTLMGHVAQAAAEEDNR